MKNIFLKKSYDFILDILFPKVCLGCGHEGTFFCEQCFSSLPIFKNAKCYVCGRRSPDGRVCNRCLKASSRALAGMLVCSDWNNLLLRQSIYDFKYRFVKELSVPLARLAVSFLEINNFFNLSHNDLIFIAVPLHRARFVWRGFNQAELLARKISIHFNLEFVGGILKRSLRTSPQMEIKDKFNRCKNISGAFSLDSNLKNSYTLFKNKTFILVDDVSTTGATLEECARTLKKLKPKEIWGLVLARG